MPNFMESFEKSRNDYLEHYGVQGMKWGVINEDEPVGMMPSNSYQQESYEPSEYEQRAVNTIRERSPEEVKQHRKEIRKKIVKGVAIAAIIGGLAVSGIKGYAEEKTGTEQSLGSSIGIAGQGIKNAATGFLKNIKSGFSMDTESARKSAEAAENVRKWEKKKRKWEKMTNSFSNSPPPGSATYFYADKR